ncbi:hypothetical protein [Selenomonas montiformis]|uniref:hypothetical protein n=1 Tax=Selenomonas montiformis TaxID=2652285 RepID=UPI0012B65C3E|nr:hypothetical protein [Selenomonas montiformis]
MEEQRVRQACCHQHQHNLSAAEKPAKKGSRSIVIHGSGQTKGYSPGNLPERIAFFDL